MAVKWGYSLNTWTSPSNSVRKENTERNFKSCSVAGFNSVEMQIGAGRWRPLGRPDIISQIYGSTKDFKKYLAGLGITDIVAWDYDPGSFFDPLNAGFMMLDILDKKCHEIMLSDIKEYAKTLAVWDSNYLVVRPIGSYWAVAPVTEEKLKVATDFWNMAGATIAEYGVKILLHIDWMCAANSKEAVDFLMKNTNPETVGLCIDTAEYTLAGMDPVQIYEEYKDRVELLHFQQVLTSDINEEYKKPYAEDIIFDGGERKIQRWYWEMGCPEGPGLVDFKRFMKTITENGYDGWIVVECKQTPDPTASLLLNSWYVQKELSDN